MEEALSLHMEVKALQDCEGISYAAAAWELYLVEVAKHSSEVVAQEGFSKIMAQIEKHYPEQPIIEALNSNKGKGKENEA